MSPIWEVELHLLSGWHSRWSHGKRMDFFRLQQGTIGESAHQGYEIVDLLIAQSKIAHVFVVHSLGEVSLPPTVWLKITLVVELHHFLESGNRTVVHVRRCQFDIAQSGGPKLTDLIRFLRQRP